MLTSVKAVPRSSIPSGQRRERKRLDRLDQCVSQHRQTLVGSLNGHSARGRVVDGMGCWRHVPVGDVGTVEICLFPVAGAGISKNFSVRNYPAHRR